MEIISIDIANKVAPFILPKYDTDIFMQDEHKLTTSRTEDLSHEVFTAVRNVTTRIHLNETFTF